MSCPTLTSRNVTRAGSSSMAPSLGSMTDATTFPPAPWVTAETAARAPETLASICEGRVTPTKPVSSTVAGLCPPDCPAEHVAVQRAALPASMKANFADAAAPLLRTVTLKSPPGWTGVVDCTPVSKTVEYSTLVSTPGMPPKKTSASPSPGKPATTSLTTLPPAAGLDCSEILLITGTTWAITTAADTANTVALDPAGP